ncbi:membrane protein required for colicin V production [Chitinophaga costaii]|uniref:Membrane protein required for colicin V production n=1 Tax=Chitinophaga costaii TaxID=1335309 RepID=A0A1C4F5F6_9BACT|nr:CvpA family protein [Chitinophaga costaii]PUZ21274.1 CvpA family protein [Chitinophaga costaii]SCC51170.1 membrane protein required for colicin V production [Chitinophaga costaii]
MTIDIIFAIILVIAVYKGFSRGLIVAVFSFVAVLLGIAVALKLSAVAALYVQQHWSMQARWVPVACYIGLFIGVVLLVRLGATALQKLVKLAMLGWADRLGGIVLYVLLYTISYSVLLWIANQLNLLSPAMKMQSVVYPWIAGWGPWIIDTLGKLMPLFKDAFAQLEHFFEQAAHHLQEQQLSTGENG